jgi:hypothetical protein
MCIRDRIEILMRVVVRVQHRRCDDSGDGAFMKNSLTDFIGATTSVARDLRVDRGRVAIPARRRLGRIEHLLWFARQHPLQNCETDNPLPYRRCDTPPETNHAV